MKASYRKDMTHNYLILSDIADEQEDTFRLKILFSNRIQSLLPLTVEHLNGETGFCYDITGLQSFASFCEYSTPHAEELKQLYAGLLDSLDELEDYLLDPGQLVLDAEYLYMDWRKKILYMPYLPVGKGNIQEKMITLTEYLLAKVGHADQQCVVFLCRILHEFRRPNADPDQLRKLVGSGTEVHEENPYPDQTTPEIENRIMPDTPHLYELPGVAEYQGFSAAEEDSTEKTVRKKSFLPDRETMLSALGMIAAAGLVWLVLNIQTRYRLSVTQMAGCCLLGASLFLLIVLTVIRKRNDRIAKKKVESREAEPVIEFHQPVTDIGTSGAEADSFSIGVSEPVPDFASRIGVEDYLKKEGMVVEWDEPIESEKIDRENHDGETVLLSELAFSGNGIPASMTPVSSDTGLKPFTIGSDDILIGHKAAFVDRVISDSTVSRIHARIFRRGGVYYVCDMGSKNGTAVDGKQAVGREEIPLSDGSHVSFARCEYVFHEGRDPA